MSRTGSLRVTGTVVGLVLTIAAVSGGPGVAHASPAGRAGVGAADPPPPVPHARPAPALAGSPWVPLTNQPPFNPGAMLLLTNGTVLVQDQGPDNEGSSSWWVLTPDPSGSYLDGTWSQVASLPANYAPLYFASAVLPDGRVIIEGGEYNSGQEAWTNKGAIYDPVANTWTTVAHPKGSGWVRIGDAPSTVLANGKFMLGASGYSGTTAEAILNEATLTWKATGTGKADGNGEEGWSLLPNGDVLTVDTKDTPNTEIYSPKTGSWTSAGDTPVDLIDGDGEVGPQLLQPNGTVFAEGATGQNAIYTAATGVWTAGPSFPVIGGQQYDSADGSSAILPNGEVLFVGSPGDYTAPSHFFMFNGTTITQTADAPNAANTASNYVYMMVLPTGQVLYNDRIGQMDIYQPTGSYKSKWQPKITSVPTSLTPGSTYTVSGKQLNGLTQGAAYGDDYQDATNYPLVRIINTASGAVTYCRTSGMTSMSVKSNQASSASFTVPAGVPTGPSTLEVVANGIPSAAVQVTVSG